MCSGDANANMMMVANDSSEPGGMAAAPGNVAGGEEFRVKVEERDRFRRPCRDRRGGDCGDRKDPYYGGEIDDYWRFRDESFEPELRRGHHRHRSHHHHHDRYEGGWYEDPYRQYGGGYHY